MMVAFYCLFKSWDDPLRRGEEFARKQKNFHQEVGEVHRLKLVPSGKGWFPGNFEKLIEFQHIPVRALFKPKEWYMGTPYHLFSTLWKIQVGFLGCFFVFSWV